MLNRYFASEPGTAEPYRALRDFACKASEPLRASKRPPLYENPSTRRPYRGYLGALVFGGSRGCPGFGSLGDLSPCEGSAVPEPVALRGLVGKGNRFALRSCWLLSTGLRKRSPVLRACFRACYSSPVHFGPHPTLTASL